MNLKDNHLILIFMVIVTVMFFCLLTMLAYHSVPQENRDLFLEGSGVVFTLFASMAQKILGLTTRTNVVQPPADGSAPIPPILPNKEIKL